MHRRVVLATALGVGACGRVDFDPHRSCVAKLASYGDQICALREDGVVLCWGDNAHGQLGDGTFTSHGLPAPTLVTDAIDLASGEDTVCAIRRDGSVACWGENDLGQVGDGTLVDQPVPTTIALEAAAVEIHLGQYHSCARLADGKGQCWGSNQFGELGSAMPAGNQPTPQLAPIGGNPAFTLGDNVTCIVRPDASVECFGRDSEGELGDGMMTARPTPMPITVAQPFAGVAGGCHRHLCGVTTSGEVWCWGENMHGEVGRAPSTFEPPTQVPGITDAVQVTVGAYHSCARTRAGDVVCWGENDQGQLGNDSLAPSFLPVRASVTGEVADVQAFCGGAFVLRTDGTLTAWGGAGLLGTGVSVDQLVPIEVPIPCP